MRSFDSFSVASPGLVQPLDAHQGDSYIHKRSLERISEALSEPDSYIGFVGERHAVDVLPLRELKRWRMGHILGGKYEGNVLLGPFV